MNDFTQFVDQVVNRQQEEKEEAIAQYQQFIEKEKHNKEQELLQQHEKKKQQIVIEQKREYQVSENSLQLKDRNNQLASKQALIEQYLADIESEFLALSPDETLDFIKSLLKRHSITEDSEVILGEQTKNKLTDLKTLNVSVNEQTIPNKAGFILTDGNIEYNYLFDSLIEESRRDLQQLLLNQMSAES